MRIKAMVTAGFAAAVISTFSFSQSQAAAAGDSAAAAATGKRAECRQGATDKQLRGPDRADFVQLCIAQAHVDCLKQAIDQKVRGQARRDFIKSCVGAGQSQPQQEE